MENEGDNGQGVDKSDVVQDEQHSAAKDERQKQSFRDRDVPDSPDNNDDDKQDSGTTEDLTTRPRRHTEATERTKREEHRKRQLDATKQDAHANNRFLRAISGADSPQEEDESTDEDDESKTTSRLLPKRGTAPRAKSTERILVTPAPNYSSWFRSGRSLPAAQRWTEELKQREAAGLFVETERQQCMRLENNTVDRLEERLRRELTPRKEEDISIDPNEELMLTSLLLPAQGTPATIAENHSADVDSNITATSSEPKGPRTSVVKRFRNVALLELLVDRVVLDDHPTFTLADRLAAHLRSLYSAYSRMQQQQPWQLSLQRLDDFFSCSTAKLAAGTGEIDGIARSGLSTRQALEEINQLLAHVDALGQLHQQLLTKANELRDVEMRLGSISTLRVRGRQRKQPIDLSRVEAVLELLEASGDNQQSKTADEEAKFQQALLHVSERLDKVPATSGHALETVLLLEGVGSEIHVNETSFWNPKFYVVIRVNGKIACTTKMTSWSRSQINFAERLRFTLSFFPNSVCAEVYEHRIFLRDKLLSTNAIPVVVPGQDISQPTLSRSSSSSFEHWGAADPGLLVPAASLAPSDEWYQFTTSTLIPRTQWHQSFHNAPLFAHTTRRTQGRLHLTVSWIQDSNLQHDHPSSGDTAYLPPRRPESAGGNQLLSTDIQLIGKSTKRDSTHLSLYLRDYGFSSEHDFLRLVDPQQMPLDPNDPDTVAVKRLQVYFAMQQQEEKAVGLGQRKIFRTSDTSCPLNTSGRGLTKRNRLLRLRDREHVARHGTSFCAAISNQEGGKVEPPRWIPQHAVFDEPMPMSEQELLADERLLRLMRPELHAFDRRLLSEEAGRADASMVERHRMRQLLKLQDFRERVRQTQIVTNYNTDTADKKAQLGRTKPLAEIVQEKPLPLFPGVIELPALRALFAPRRRLRPRAKLPTAISSSQTAAHWPTTCTLYVQVHKAINVPVRIKPARNAGEGDEATISKRRRRGSLQRANKKSPRSALSPTGDNQSEDVHETPREGTALEYESHVFVQISFQGKTRQTTCATITGKIGNNSHGVSAHPVWMETLALPFNPPRADWSPESIEGTQDVVRFNLFDQVTRTASTPAAAEDRQEGEERLGAQTRSLHRENCFLGSFEVPFLTLYRAGRLEGSLRCEMPVEHFGYINLQIEEGHRSASTANTSTAPVSAASSDGEAESPRHRRSRGFSLSSPIQKRMSISPRNARSPRSPSDVDGDDSGDLDGLGVAQEAREATYLKLTLQLDPVLPMVKQIPDSDQKETWTAESSNAQDKLLFAHAQRWAAAVRSSTPANAVLHRNYNAFVRNLSHGATFLPRFLRAQSPPPELLSADLPALVHYVSLIPFLDDWLAFDSIKDVWSTTQEFLYMGAGDHEEHAVLLANFFMWYDRRHREQGTHQHDQKIYLVLGYAVPEGNIVYVLRRGVLWNASTGVGYAVSDPHCPLRDVSLVVSSKNIFANVQPLGLSSNAPFGGCHQLNWSIEKNTRCWRPFFTGKNISVPPSVQRRELTYTATPPDFVEQVERELRESLKLAVRRWRSSHFATNFNELAGLQLRDHLVVLEREAAIRRGSHVATTAAHTDENTSPSPRSTSRIKQKLKLKLKLATQRAHPGHSVLREMQRSREVCGLPLHVSFTDIPRVLNVVENTVRLEFV